jgi:integrase
LCCRASEYLAPVSPEKIMLVGDVMPMAGRRYTDWSDPAVDGIMARFRSSKTDQYNEGALRYVGKTTNSRCVVKALIEWYALDSAHFEEHDDRPMFRYPNGKVMTREEMQHDLREAAVDCEIDEQRFGTHSWRVSGATWLYQAGYDIETIKRHGRWTSGVVHVYLWEGTGQQGLAAKMSAVDFVIHAQLPR